MELEIVVEILKTNTKHPAILHDGYMFRFNRKITGGETYRCTKSKSCSSKVRRRLEKYYLEGEHDHEPPENAISAKRRREKELEVAARSRNVSTNDVLTESELLVTEMGAVGHSKAKTDSDRRRIRRDKARLHGETNLGVTMETVKIPETLQKTKAGSQFLLYDSGPSNERTVIYATKEHLEILAYCSVWLMDGTFQSCPEPFKQIYSIHGVVDGKTALPLVYAYLPGKSEAIYQNFLSQVKTHTRGGPEIIIIDFEMAVINACRELFPEDTTALNGCLFHLKQSVYRHVQKNSSVFNLYTERSEKGKLYRSAINALGALAFLPEAEVDAGFNEIKGKFRSDEPIHVVFDYFKKTYVGSDEWTPPRYPKKFWNVRDRFLANQPRTTNAKEGWHYRFNSVPSNHNPSLCKSLENVMREENHTSSEIAKLKAGHSPGLNSKSVIINGRLQNIIYNQTETQLYTCYTDFLDAVTLAINGYLDLHP